MIGGRLGDYLDVWVVKGCECWVCVDVSVGGVCVRVEMCWMGGSVSGTFGTVHSAGT